MSMPYPLTDCQTATTQLSQELAAFLEAAQRELDGPACLPLALPPTPLALCAAWLAPEFPRQVVIAPHSTKKSQRFLAMIAAWQALFGHTATWHVLTGELTDQEQSGQITTSLSSALHHLLSATPQHHFVVPEEALALPLPTAREYRSLQQEIHVGERVVLKSLVNNVVSAGYRRVRVTLEPGSLRVRGEQIDISHPALPGTYTITLYGKSVESITVRRGRRSTNVTFLVIPPLKFPASSGSLAAATADCLIYQPARLPVTATRTVQYDALQPKLAFPFAVGTDAASAVQKEVVVLYENLERVKEWLHDHPHGQATLCRTGLAHHPVLLSTTSTAIVSEATLLPPAATARPVSYQQGLVLLANLRVGRAAVHADHGIGIYEGLQTRTIQGNDHDYLILRYAAGDVLSVPVEFAHKVTAYLGSGIPKLHRLGGSLWLSTRKKARQEAHRLAQMLLSTARARAGRNREPYYIDPALAAELAHSFPYELTRDQEATWEAVVADLQREVPMDRLIVGDVGFGKTEIAVRAARHIAANSKQVALLAPTTLLVQQHTDTLRARLPALRERIGMLSRFTSPAQARALRGKIAAGEVNIVVGTHALLSRRTTWQALGLVIIDEEQRFGVLHKEHFKKLRAMVDVLSLSATPIPRTLSMALSGLKELSVISTPPAGRKSVATYVGLQRDAIMAQAIARERARAGQVYVVAPKIRALAALTASLKKLVPGARIAGLHSQIENAALAATMEQFDTGAIDVLVSSTIIENGLDVPNANTLIVLQATHFGLSELYQLRGRIGRRERQGYAYFLYDQQELTSRQRQRLTALTEAARLGSGWSLAQRDLEIRGAGNLLGAEQSGTIKAVGVQLYLDMVHDASVGERDTLSHREVELHLPLPARLPASYIADVAVRVEFYQRLSRAVTPRELERVRRDIENSFGAFPAEANNLYRLVQLQHVAATAGITDIHHQTITPVDEEPYARLIIDGRDLPVILKQVHRLGHWRVRDNSLTLDVSTINTDLVRKLFTSLGTT